MYDPLDEFHKMVGREFGRLLERIDERIVQMFCSVEITEKGIDFPPRPSVFGARLQVRALSKRERAGTTLPERLDQESQPPSGRRGLHRSWTSASDRKNLCYYFHTFQSRRIRMIDLKQVNLDAKDIRTISMGEKASIENLSRLAK